MLTRWKQSSLTEISSESIFRMNKKIIKNHQMRSTPTEVREWSVVLSLFWLGEGKYAPKIWQWRSLGSVHKPILQQIQSSAGTKWKIELHHKIYSRKWSGFEKNSLLRYLTSPSSSWRQSLEFLFSSWYLNWCLHLAMISEPLFSRSFPVSSAIASFSVAQSANLWVAGL